MCSGEVVRAGASLQLHAGCRTLVPASWAGDDHARRGTAREIPALTNSKPAHA